MRLPDFLGIGALKAGTSYLDGLLRGHPQLCLPAIKEVDFFTRHYERGPAWYSRKFTGCGARRAGEVSPQYLSDPRCPARIHGLLPEARLLVTVRDPVQRAYSQYKHWVQSTAYRGDFARFLDDHPNAVEAGRYSTLLARYLQVFEAERLHVVVFEDLIAEPVAVMQGVFGFLGVDPGHVPDRLEATNVSMRPRFPRAFAQARRASGWLREHGASRLVDWVKGAGARRVFEAAETDGFARLDPATAARLCEIYREDVVTLSELLDRDLRATWTSITPV